MTPTTTDQYLRRLRTELRGLPKDRRQEILAQVNEHIAAHRPEAGTEGEQDMAAILKRLGDPAEIGADARDRFGVQPRRPAALEVFALLLIGLGPMIVLLPLAMMEVSTGGRLVGLILLVPLWLSRVWLVRDKLIGTLLLVGGSLALAFMLHLYDHSSRSSSALVIAILTAGAAPFFAAVAFLWVRIRRLTPRGAAR